MKLDFIHSLFIAVHIYLSLFDISAELINRASHPFWLTECHAFFSKLVLHALLSPLRPPDPIVPVPAWHFLAREKGGCCQESHLVTAGEAQPAPCVPQGSCRGSAYPFCLAQWLHCFSMLLWPSIPTGSPASEAVAVVPLWPVQSHLSLPMITNIAQSICSTTSQAPFGMKNKSPLDVSTGLHGNQHKNAELQIYSQTYLNQRTLVGIR